MRINSWSNLFSNTLQAIAIISLVSLTTPQAYAATTTSLGLSVNPALIEATIKPGESRQESINIRNTGTNPVSLHITFTDGVSQNDSEPLSKTANTTNKLSSLLKLSTDTLTLAPNEEKQIIAAITTDNHTPNQSYTGIISIASVSEGQSGTSGTTASVSSIMLINVGNGQNHTKVDSFTQSWSDDQKNLIFTTKITNESQFLQKTKGRILIYDTWGKLAKTLQINENALNILPNTKRTFQSTWTKPEGFGHYTAKVELFTGMGKTTTSNQTLNFYLINKTKAALTVPILGSIIALIHFSSRKKRKTA